MVKSFYVKHSLTDEYESLPFTTLQSKEYLESNSKKMNLVYSLINLYAW